MMPTNSPLRLTTGLPELPPMMSAVETKLNGVSRFSLSLRFDPALRQVEGRLVVVLVGVLVGAAEASSRAGSCWPSLRRSP